MTLAWYAFLHSYITLSCLITQHKIILFTYPYTFSFKIIQYLFYFKSEQGSMKHFEEDDDYFDDEDYERSIHDEDEEYL